MPLTAKDKNGESISILDYENPKQSIEVDGLTCAHCNEDLFIRSPSEKLDHFCHYPDSDCLESGESLKHLLGKNQIANTLLDQYDDEIEIEVECPVSDRIADVLATHKGGQRVAHELQLASITKKQVHARSLNYLQEGVDVCWWFGPKVSSEVREFTVKTYGGAISVSVEIRHAESSDIA
jgi:competence CoiA-like predicted nuclease